MTAHTSGGRLHVTDRPGEEPALVLMHGCPGDSRIYDRPVPLLRPRRTVTFDFLGYGRSDRSEASTLDVPDRQQELEAVVDTLGPDSITLIGHDRLRPPWRPTMR